MGFIPQIVFRTPDPNEATYLAAMLDGAVGAEDVQTLGLRQCYIKTSDANGPLPVVSATLPPPPFSNGRTAGLIAAACARRYGRSIVEVMAMRERWMATLFQAARQEYRQTLEASSDGARHAEVVEGTAASESERREEEMDRQKTDAMSAGSQPVLGLPVTRPGAGAARPRRGRRRRRQQVPSPQPSSQGPTLFDGLAGIDPLPQLTATSLDPSPQPRDHEAPDARQGACPPGAE